MVNEQFANEYYHMQGTHNNDCCEFHSSDGINMNSVHQSFLKTPVSDPSCCICSAHKTFYIFIEFYDKMAKTTITL